MQVFRLVQTVINNRDTDLITTNKLKRTGTIGLRINLHCSKNRMGAIEQ